ncbi:GLUG motif-containing protein [Ruminococcus sp. Marseille-P6503]|uniref:GLUG motif-containing protein n=1 Tax=Ruminococcus sp. Marseille-P6503 TaxID=2364796 RepID=UPI000F52717A|nr:GLUG motif-containing protein [Ruminococcus sp. Marseille-P6503]
MKMKKRILGLLLTFSLLLGLVPAGSVALTAWAEGEEPELSSDGYYEIYTADQLYWFAEQVNGGNAGINARLMDNIVINENVLTADGELNGDGSGFRVWTPIGNDEDDKIFTGTFDGNNKTISGIYLNNDYSNDQGLFGYNNGTIQNVGVVDSYVKGFFDVGGVCGSNMEGIISNCYNTGTVGGFAWVGGVCGSNDYEYATISNCYNTGAVSGESRYVDGLISDVGDYVGGVCGGNDGSIINCYNIATVSGGNRVGGVSGNNDRSYSIISNCYNTGAVIANGEYGNYVGGVSAGNYGTISNCYNTGAVSGKGNYVGGVSGDNVEYGAISNCYNIGTISGNNYVGGVCGNNAVTISNCYYLYTSYSTGIGEGSGEAVSKISAQFASGEVCWLLNNQGENGEQLEAPVWYQNIDMGDADALPLLNNGHYAVYKTEECTYECEAVKPSGEYTNIASGEHSYEAGWKNDAEKHWHECGSCGEISEEAHTFEWITDKEAEVGVAGSKHEECTVCGYAKEAVEIPALELPDDSSATDSTDDESSTVDDSSAADSESSQLDDSEESTAASDSKAESANDSSSSNSNSSSSTSGDKSPNTGDNRSVLLFAFVLVGGTALAGMTAYSKKRGKQGR